MRKKDRPAKRTPDGRRVAGGAGDDGGHVVAGHAEMQAGAEDAGAGAGGCEMNSFTLFLL